MWHSVQRDVEYYEYNQKGIITFLIFNFTIFVTWQQFDNVETC